MLHDNIHVGNAPWNRPGRVCNVWRLTLDVQVDALWTDAVGTDIDGGV